MIAVGITVLFTALVGLGAVGLLIYVIVNRINQKDREKFQDRDN
jgi:hypothetical protein